MSTSTRGRKWRVMEHEADTGLLIYGGSYEDLFRNGAYALFSLIFDLRKVRKRETRRFSIRNEDDALIIFLNELLYQWDAHRFIPKSVTVRKDGAWLHAAAEGEPFDSARHSAGKEIKAATYHGFSVKEHEGGGLEARVILDI